MAIDFGKLMNLCEASSGFVGGNCVDEMPHLTLEECVNQLPVAIMEQQIELIESFATHNEALVEATIASIGTSDYSDIENLVEMSWKDIKANIDKVLENIKKFLSSIVAKLTLQIDKIRMSGHQLYSKYANRPEYKNKTWKDLTINGYKFKNGNIFNATDSYISADNKAIKSLIAKCVGESNIDPDDFVAKDADIAEGSDAEKGSKKIIDKLNEVSASTAAYKMATQLVSCKINESSWESDIYAALGMDEKTEIEYGKDGFDKATIEGLLKEPHNLTAIKEQYTKLRNSVDSFKKDLKSSIEKNETEMDKLTKEDNSKGKSNALSLANAYYNAYIKFVNNAYGTISKVQNIRFKFENERVKQAKTMFGKMLSYKDPKSDNNDASDFTEFELEVEL